MDIICTDTHRPSPMELASAFLKRAKASTDKVQAAFFSMVAEATAKAEVFEFGEVPEHRLKDEAKRGGELYGAKLLDLPYQSVIYWYRCIPEEESIELVEKLAKHDPHFRRVLSVKGLRFGTIAFKKSAVGIESETGGPICAVDLNRLEDSLKHDAGVSTKEAFLVVSGGVFRSEGDNWAGGLHYPERGTFKSETEKDVLGSLADGVMAMSMILQTRGIELRKEEPPEKLNKKRAASGKPLLSRVTHVNAKAYFEAARNTRAGGSHASPVPHLRRGHVRTYQDGRKVWIRDALVNCRSLSELGNRDHYEVETA